MSTEHTKGTGRTEDEAVAMKLRALGRAVRQTRERFAITAEELAGMVGVQPADVEALEEDGGFEPDLKLLLALGEALRIGPAALMSLAQEEEMRAATGAFGGRLRELREAQGLSREHLGRMSDIHPGMIGRMECGGREPRLRSILALARALDVQPGRLLDGLGEYQRAPGLVAIEIPPELVLLVRSGLLADIADAAERIGEAAAEPDLDRVIGRLVGPLEDLDNARMLLVALGCESHAPACGVTVSLDQYRETLLCAAHTAVEHEKYLAEDPDIPPGEKTMAYENRALLERLIVAINGTL